MLSCVRFSASSSLAYPNGAVLGICARSGWRVTVRIFPRPALLRLIK